MYNYMDIKKIISNTLLRRIIYTVVAVIAILVVFNAGMAVGFRKATFMNTNSAFGRVVKIDDESFVVRGPQGMDKMVFYDRSTMIRRLRDNVPPDGLNLNDYVAVVGTPNNACQLQAKIIRIAPPPFKK